MFNESDLYYEKCDEIVMPTYPFFLPKLKQIEKIAGKYRPKSNNINSESKSNNINSESKSNNINSESKSNTCPKCLNAKYYRLSNIVWSPNIEHRIKSHQLFPSDYFVKIIMGTCIINNTIINPPIILKLDQIPHFNYVRLSRNNLQIIDALMKQGSQQRYLVPKDRINPEDRYVYSEHSGVISVNGNTVDNIIVSTETNRLDESDDGIYLPTNTKQMSNHYFFFHTHPNTKTNAGRLPDGILYEFPSANDIYNFINYNMIAIVQASIIVAAEGAYVIRKITNQIPTKIDKKFYPYLRKFILKLEKMAIKKIQPSNLDLTDENLFHEKIGSNISFVKILNKFVEPINIYIEYYPRIKINNEWILDEINLAFVDPS